MPQIAVKGISQHIPIAAAVGAAMLIRPEGASGVRTLHDAGANHDPDGSSDGTMITITK